MTDEPTFERITDGLEIDFETLTPMIDSHETNLESRALAADLIRHGHAGVMDCETRRTAALVWEATEDMTPDELRRLIHQLAWIGGALAAFLPDNPRLATVLAGFVTNGELS